MTQHFLNSNVRGFKMLDQGLVTRDIGTVNVDIFAQLNFRAASPWLHFRVDKFSHI